MKIIYNKIIPFPGFQVVNLFGILFARTKLDCIDINHEAIHTKQMKELLYIFFYLWYFIEWLILIFKYKDVHTAYRNIRFEKEAYTYEKDITYLSNRKHYNYL